MLEGKVTGFQDILGNDMVKEHFKKAIENHKISHAYILTGEAGMGRKSIANAFAMTLLCEKGAMSLVWYAIPANRSLGETTRISSM